jgi:hypothetical protein
MDRYEGPLTDLTTALYRGLYFAIIMDRYGGPKTALTIALHDCLYLAIIMDPSERALQYHYYNLAEASS